MAGGALDEQITKARCRVSNEGGMTFHNHSLEMTNALCDRGEVFRRNCVCIEEAAGVVEFDLSCVAGKREARFSIRWKSAQLVRRKLPERVINLRGNRPRRHAFGQSIFPQIAINTPPRTFPVGQKDCRACHHRARFRSLRFDEEVVRTKRIELHPRVLLNSTHGPGEFRHAGFTGTTRGIAFSTRVHETELAAATRPRAVLHVESGAWEKQACRSP